MIARWASTGLLLVGLTGCGWQIGWYTCDNPDEDHIGPNGKPDPCHYQDPHEVDPRCAVGDFMHWEVGWDDPTWLWIGSEDQAPACPNGLVSTAYEGHTDLVAPDLCEACTCEPPTGSCALPSTLTASTLACNIPGGSTTSFNAPAPWNGECDSTTQTPDGAAHSLTIDPLVMTENGCAPGPIAPAKVVSLRWDTFARGCDVVGWLPGPTQRSACIRQDPLPAGFRWCVFQKGINECPATPGNVFTEQHVFYQGVQDDRQCSACSCGAPTGSACTATISIYKGNDLTCGSSPVVPGITVSSAGPVCLDIALPGQALGSKLAGPAT